MASVTLAIFPASEEPPRTVRALAEQVAEDGGVALAAYREPVGKNWQIFAILPLSKVKPTPYQRDLSKAHLEKLKKVITKLDRFVDPVVAVRGPDGGYWTPNGNHRRSALEKMKAATIPVILLAEPEVAFQILALNTEKAHNLKEKSLEVIRMFRGLMEDGTRKAEEDLAFRFEEPHFITLGLLYEKSPRFSGSVHAPILKRVDAFLKQALAKAYEERQHRAELVERADALLTQVAARLKKRGIVHPYVKNFVMARVNPLTRARKTLPSFDQTWEKLQANLDTFDPDTVKTEDIARAAVVSAS